MENHSELLDIRQAAEFLRVSEMSLRRWTNAGRLGCFRVGGRRERRFRRADLLAFMQPQPRAAWAEMLVEPAHADLAAGHLSSLYTSDLARVRQAVDFLAEAEHSARACFLVAAPPVRDRILALLERRHPSLRHDIEAGRFVLTEYARSAEAQLEFWETRLQAASRKGVRSFRVVGDVSGGRLARKNEFAEVLEYESVYDRSIARRFAVSTLCLYDVRRLSGIETARLFRCHADMFRYPIDRLLS